VARIHWGYLWWVLGIHLYPPNRGLDVSLTEPAVKCPVKPGSLVCATCPDWQVAWVTYPGAKKTYKCMKELKAKWG
jgi:hypothetical protein